jgi:hypothetical protein
MYYHYHMARALAEAHVADLQRANPPLAASRPAASTASGRLAIRRLLRKATALVRPTLIGTARP